MTFAPLTCRVEEAGPKDIDVVDLSELVFTTSSLHSLQHTDVMDCLGTAAADWTDKQALKRQEGRVVPCDHKDFYIHKSA